MRNRVLINLGLTALMTVVLSLLAPGMALAVQPIVKTVPWVATNTTVPHDSWIGRTNRFKGTVNVGTAAPAAGAFSYFWDFGDGNTTALAPVTAANLYNLEATHAYTSGAVNTIYTAHLTVVDNNTAQQDVKSYLVIIRNPPPNLPIEVNAAIDDGLWYLHKSMTRHNIGAIPAGDWVNCTTGFNKACGTGEHGPSGENVNAFEVNGHLQNGDPNNPYTETVARGMAAIFSFLETSAITSPVTIYTGSPVAAASKNTDGNGNGFGVRVNSGNELYQDGMIMDALVAAGTPGATANTGPAAVVSPPNPGIVGRTYSDIVQDMADYYSYCQHPGSAPSPGFAGTTGGGWRYSCQQAGDSSAAQWAAIGLIPAQRVFGNVIDPLVKQSDLDFVVTTQDPTDGHFGYTTPAPIWGPYADTPSGMVQMAFDGVGRGSCATRWDKAETFMRDNFDNPPAGGAGTSVKAYYYGLFSFVKSLLLHDPVGNGVAQPITFLQSCDNPAKTPIDWYNAEFSKGDTSDGVARTLVAGQGTDGGWSGHNYVSNQYPLETGIAIIMLNRTIFSSGAPVACATATPNPIPSGATVQLRGNCSFQQDPTKQIVQWDWDVSGNGCGPNFNPTLHGVNVSAQFTANVFPTNIPVCLRVTDNSSPAKTADTTITITVSAPPRPPTANAGGPYNICPQDVYLPFYLNGSGSTNPDEGTHQTSPPCPTCPNSTIVSYEWFFNGQNPNTSAPDATGPQPKVADKSTGAGPSPFVPSRIGQTFNVTLKVTNNDNLAFPAAGLASGLSSIANAQVTVHAATDQVCTHCVSTAQLNVKRGTPGNPPSVTLAWQDPTPANHYNIYRSTAADFSGAVKIGTANPVPGNPTAAGVWTFTDTAVSAAAPGPDYYYRIAPATLNDTETCQSNQTFKAHVTSR